MNMIEILLSRSKGSKASAQPPRPPASRDPIDPPPRKIQPYEVPCPDGKNRLVELPEEALVKVMTLLDRTSLTRCFRLCKAINELCNANSSIALHHLLLCNSLILNANILKPSTNINLVPPSTAQLLNTLRERLTRFRNIAPKSQHRVKFEEKEGNLYEYLEGVLLRGVSRGLTTGLSSNQVAIYDLRQLNDWEDIEPVTGRMDPEVVDYEDNGNVGVDGGNAVGDLPARVRDSLETLRRKRRRSEAALGPDGQPEEIEETTESEAAAEVRTLKSFAFTIREFAVDPGQDLLVLVEVKTDQQRAHSMYIHLVTLSTFEPHPRAKVPVLKWPETLARPRVTLNFQICDDGLFVMLNNSFDGPVDSILGWQWTTGHHAMTLKAQRNMTFESFILLSPSSLVIPAVVSGVDPDSDIQHQLENGDDLIFRHELRLYAFPPLSTISTPTSGSSAPVTPPHAGTHVATLDLPEFYTNLGRNIPPPRLIIRADPPPRRTLPTHPLGVTGLQQFVPEPTSGVVVVEFLCQMPDVMVNPHYVMLVMKEYLSSFCLMSMAAMQSQVFPRQAPVIAWDTIRHHVRLFGPNLRQSSWVCYVYQNRYVTTRLEYDDDDDDEDDEESDLPMGYIRLYDFDPLRVRKEICDRKYDIIPLVDPTIPLGPNTPTTANTGSTSPQRQSYTRRMSNLFRRPASIDGDKTGDQATPDNPLLQPLSGDRNGIVLVTEETNLADELPLMSQIFTGSKLPYIYAERETIADTVLIDGERIIGVLQDSWPEGGDDEDEEAEEAIELEVSDF